jgi:glutamate carboxypeptidase
MQPQQKPVCASNMSDPLVTFLESRLDSYLAELQAVASIDSYSYDRDDVNHVVDWLESRLKTLGFDVTRQTNVHSGDSLLATRKGRGKGRIMLLGHSDTVFPRGTTAQRPITYQGDKILGPGTCDMKAGLLVGIYAVEALDAVGLDNYWTL